MSLALNRLAQRLLRLEKEVAASRTPQLAYSSVTADDGTEIGVVEGLTTAMSASAGLAGALDRLDTAEARLDGVVETYFQEAEPTGANEGDLWFRDSDNRLHRLTGGVWVEIVDADIVAAIDAAQNAQTTADGKISAYWQGSAPTGASEGDLWYDTSNGNVVKRLTSGVWQPLLLGTGAIADDAITSDKIGDLTTPPTVQGDPLVTDAQLAAVDQAASDAAAAAATADGKAVAAQGAADAAAQAAATADGKAVAAQSAASSAASAASAAQSTATSAASAAATADGKAVAAQGAASSAASAASAAQSTASAVETLTDGWKAADSVSIDGGAIFAGSITAASGAIADLDASKITVGKLVGSQIETGTLTAAHLTAGTITAASGVIGSLDASKITVGKLVGSQIDTGTLTAAHLVAGTITAASGVIGSLDASKITVGKITAAQMEAGTITAASGVIGSIDAAKITVGKITASQLQAGTITAASGVIGSIDASKITVGQITGAQIAADAIDGKVINGVEINGGTFTGGLFQTASAGQRWKLDSSAVNVFSGYTNDPAESLPGQLFIDAPAGGVDMIVGLNGADPTHSGINPSIWLRTSKTNSGTAIDNYGLIEVSAGRTDFSGGVRLTSTRPGDGLQVSSMTPLQQREGTGKSTTTSTYTPTAVTVANCGLSFVAPPSGTINIQLSALLRSQVAGKYVRVDYQIREGATIGAGNVIYSGDTGVSTCLIATVSVDFHRGAGVGLHAGLTPGQTYNIFPVMASHDGVSNVSVAGTRLVVTPCL